MNDFSLKMIEKTKIDKYIYGIKGLNVIPADGDKIEIVFINGKLDAIYQPFGEPYTRENWYILSLIEKTISELEEKYIQERKNHEA